MGGPAVSVPSLGVVCVGAQANHLVRWPMAPGDVLGWLWTTGSGKGFGGYPFLMTSQGMVMCPPYFSPSKLWLLLWSDTRFGDLVGSPLLGIRRSFCQGLMGILSCWGVTGS
ncbi:hypothetical protein AMECASPLE_018588 [Ameca splendens]|uniref:Uncharacterized protein n=1 Tax=Ameca splendens TaxID=208324 RepID=A0ABV0YPP3_9TELE